MYRLLLVIRRMSSRLQWLFLKRAKAKTSVHCKSCEQMETSRLLFSRPLFRWTHELWYVFSIHMCEVEAITRIDVQSWAHSMGYFERSEKVTMPTKYICSKCATIILTVLKCSNYLTLYEKWNSSLDTKLHSSIINECYRNIGVREKATTKQRIS